MFVQYGHNERLVWVRGDLKGHEDDFSLCFSCRRFKPGSRENCRIAKEIHALCVRENLVLPVWECPLFEESHIVVSESAKPENSPGGIG